MIDRQRFQASASDQHDKLPENTAYTNGDYVAAFITLCCFGATVVFFLLRLLGVM